MELVLLPNWKRNGWELARVSGSHHVYVKQGRMERISVPIHGNENLKIGLLKHLMKMAGLNQKDI